MDGFRSFAVASPNEPSPLLQGEGCVTNQLRFEDITVLVGPNGAGKSTVTSFFDLLNFMTTSALQEYVGRQGGANSLLHYGAKRTPVMHAKLEFEDEDAQRRSEYRIDLAYAADDSVIFTGETTEYHQAGHAQPRVELLGAGHRESALRDSAEGGNNTSRVLLAPLSRCRSYHFHDTSETARIRQSAYVEDNRYVRSDAGNLAAFLYGLKRNEATQPYYERIERTVQLAFPQLKAFSLEPRQHNENTILLNWYACGYADYLLGPHQISDGALRFAALTTLLLQPPENLPSLIVLDEPELGLHPHAIALLAEMLRGAAANAQVLVATQSPVLVNFFDLSQIRPIEHRKGRSVILDLDPKAYEEWLDEYSTGELWEKNIIGGNVSGG